ncbi:MAG TPA: penicillin-binding protein [Myxococcales bacterium]|jgi:cell division protein FtsI (penicillin-binding protein 3)
MTRTSNSSVGADPRSIRWIRLRVALLALTFVPLFGAVLWRAVNLQVVEGPKLASMAADQSQRNIMVPGRRGSVYDRRGVALAASVEVDSIFADPSDLGDLKKAAKDLGKVLAVDPGKLEASFNASRRFAWVKRQVSEQEAAAVKALKLQGLGIVKEARRFYPQRELASHLLGFPSIDGEGIEGLELAFDGVLKGKPQNVKSVRDARGRSAIVEGAISSESLEGASVTLTIDKVVQYSTEKALAAAVTKADAASGMAVALDPATGEVLALANVPTFNPNDPARSPKAATRNRALADQFEPGSTMKVFTIAGALEEKAVKPSSTFFCEKGSFAIGKHTIHDHGGYADLDVGGIIQVSSNIGAAKIASKLGRERLQAYQRAFGFGERPGTGLNGEAKGSLPYPRAEIALATQSFGQGMTTSALQLASAYAAIANGGQLMKPYLVSRIVDPDGAVLQQREPEKVRQVVSQATAREVVKMMKSVVEKGGTAPLAKMEDYEVAGKTGTAQKADPATGGYSVDKRTATFVGIVPADAPRLVILVVIDEPKGDVYGGLVAAPAFKEIAQVALAHLGVPPSPSKIAEKLAAKKPEAAVAAAEQPKVDGKLAGAFAIAALQPSLQAAAAATATAEDGFVEDSDSADQEGSSVVPDVQGLTARAAVKTLTAAYLEPTLLGSGKAIGQTPPAGTSVRRGSRVAVRLESKL